MSINLICDMCNDTIGEGEAYGLQTVLIEKDWIDCRDGDPIERFVHTKCYRVVVQIYSQDIVDGFIDLDDPFGLKEDSNAELVSE